MELLHLYPCASVHLPPRPQPGLLAGPLPHHTCASIYSPPASPRGGPGLRWVRVRCISTLALLCGRGVVRSSAALRTAFRTSARVCILDSRWKPTKCPHQTNGRRAAAPRPTCPVSSGPRRPLERKVDSPTHQPSRTDGRARWACHGQGHSPTRPPPCSPSCVSSAA